MFLLLGLCVAAASAQLFEINSANNVSYYPYGVHRPVNFNSSSLPPAIFFLHGKGSAGSIDQAQTLLAYNGIGWELSQYAQGNYSQANVIAAEQFLCILPLANDGYIDATGVTGWRPERVLPTLYDASTKYAFNASRVLVVGYSAGSRAVWPILFNSSTQWASLVGSNGSAWANSTLDPAVPFAGAIAVGGQPTTAQYANLSSIVGLPMRNYLGSNDNYPESDSAAIGATQSAMQAAAQKVNKTSTLQLVTVTSSHEDLQYGTAFNLDMMQWLLNQTAVVTPAVTNSTNSTIASSSSSVAGSATSTASATLQTGVAANQQAAVRLLGRHVLTPTEKRRRLA